MKTRKPPRLAAWLLKWMGAADDPLAGDLIEEFQNGRSAAWFWRQSLWAIVTGMGRQLRASRRYYGAVTLGFAAQACVSYWLLKHSWPHVRPGSGVGAYALLMTAGAWVAVRMWRPGGSKGYLQKRLSGRHEFGARRLRSLTVYTAVAHFSIYLYAYFLSTYLRADYTVGFWAYNQVIWFVSNLVSDLKRHRSL